MSASITFTVRRGRHAGLVLTPHRFGDGCFHAHKNNSRSDPQGRQVPTHEELLELARLGYHVRMSAPGHAPSTVKPTLGA